MKTAAPALALAFEAEEGGICRRRPVPAQQKG